MPGCQRGSWGSLWKAGVKTASPLHRLDARKRPLGRFRDEWLRGGGEFLEECANPYVLARTAHGGGIAEGDASVSHEATPLRALDRASAKDGAKLLFVHCGQPFEPRQKERFTVWRFS